MQIPNDDSKKPAEGAGVTDANYYGIASGIAGLIIGFGLIAFMFALADGFS